LSNSPSTKPPRIARAILRSVLREQERDDVDGDLLPHTSPKHQIHNTIAVRSRSAGTAQRWRLMESTRF
jgi:hypothetical protein